MKKDSDLTVHINDLVIMYVEDEDSVREGLLRLLTRRFNHVIPAVDGQDGLEKFIQLKPDIVITDIQMPAMDGLQMSEKIRGMNPSVPILITTAFNNTPYLEYAKRIGINKYIKKPIMKDELFTALLECGNELKKIRGNWKP